MRASTWGFSELIRSATSLFLFIADWQLACIKLSFSEWVLGTAYLLFTLSAILLLLPFKMVLPRSRSRFNNLKVQKGPIEGALHWVAQVCLGALLLVGDGVMEFVLGIEV